MTAHPKWSAERVKSVIAQDQVDTLPTSDLSPYVNVVGSKLAPIPVPRHSSGEDNTLTPFAGPVVELDWQVVVREPLPGALGPLD